MHLLPETRAYLKLLFTDRNDTCMHLSDHCCCRLKLVADGHMVLFENKWHRRQSMKATKTDWQNIFFGLCVMLNSLADDKNDSS